MGSGIETDVRRKPGSDPSRGLKCSFADGKGTLPGPSQGRGARRKLTYKQTQLSFDVTRGSSELGRISSNQKREWDTDSMAEGRLVKKMKVL